MSTRIQYLAPTPVTITVYDRYGSFEITVTDQFCERMIVAMPSGRLAGYPEARERDLAEARRGVAEYVTRYQRLYPHATTVELTCGCLGGTISCRHRASSRVNV